MFGFGHVHERCHSNRQSREYEHSLNEALLRRVAALFGNVRQCGCNCNNNNKPSCPAGAPEFTRTGVMLNVQMTVVVGTSRMPLATLMVTAVCPVKCRSSK
jgi:hypothetical protein